MRSPAPPVEIFDRRVVRLHRERAAAVLSDHDFLLREVGERLCDRLDDVRRSFALALDLGARAGQLAALLRGRGGIRKLVQAELSGSMLNSAAGGLKVVACEENQPFAARSFDLVLSTMSLHWVNDLPGALRQINYALKPDGLFLGAMLGGRTLMELREVLAEAELACEGGLSPRASPLADIKDVGNLLQRAGFAHAIADGETITVRYAEPLALLRDLRGMGETNAVLGRKRNFLPRRTLVEAMRLYRERYSGIDGRLAATFDVIFLTGWAPAAQA